MNTLSSRESTRGRANRWRTIVQQLLTGVGGALMLLSPILLCLAAGRWNWLAGWLFGLTLLISIIVSRVLVAVKSPGLLAERARWVKGESAEGWDQLLLPIVGVYGPLAVLVVAGLDERFGWPPPIAPWVQVVAFAVALAGFAFATWAMVANRFFSAVVRIQTDRGQTVVTSGPYRFVRAPGLRGRHARLAGRASGPGFALGAAAGRADRDRPGHPHHLGGPDVTRRTARLRRVCTAYTGAPAARRVVTLAIAFRIILYR